MEFKLTEDNNPFRLASNDFLVAAGNAKIDLYELSRKELANRGLDRKGNWVGFEKAKKIHNLE